MRRFLGILLTLTMVLSLVTIPTYAAAGILKEINENFSEGFTEKITIYDNEEDAPDQKTHGNWTIEKAESNNHFNIDENKFTDENGNTISLIGVGHASGYSKTSYFYNKVFGEKFTISGNIVNKVAEKDRKLILYFNASSGSKNASECYMIEISKVKSGNEDESAWDRLKIKVSEKNILGNTVLIEEADYPFYMGSDAENGKMAARFEISYDAQSDGSAKINIRLENQRTDATDENGKTITLAEIVDETPRGAGYFGVVHDDTKWTNVGKISFKYYQDADVENWSATTVAGDKTAFDDVTRSWTVNDEQIDSGKDGYKLRIYQTTKYGTHDYGIGSQYPKGTAFYNRRMFGTKYEISGNVFYNSNANINREMNIYFNSATMSKNTKGYRVNFSYDETSKTYIKLQKNTTGTSGGWLDVDGTDVDISSFVHEKKRTEADFKVTYDDGKIKFLLINQITPDNEKGVTAAIGEVKSIEYTDTSPIATGYFGIYFADAFYADAGDFQFVYDYDENAEKAFSTDANEVLTIGDEIIVTAPVALANTEVTAANVVVTQGDAAAPGVTVKDVKLNGDKISIKLDGLSANQTYSIAFTGLYDKYGTDMPGKVDVTIRPSKNVYIDAAASLASLNDSAVEYSFKYSNYAESTPTYVIVALYGASNEMLDVDAITKDITKETGHTAIGELTVPAGKTAERVIAYAWDSAETIKPYCEAVIKSLID